MDLQNCIITVLEHKIVDCTVTVKHTKNISKRPRSRCTGRAFDTECYGSASDVVREALRAMWERKGNLMPRFRIMPGAPDNL